MCVNTLMIQLDPIVNMHHQPTRILKYQIYSKSIDLACLRCGIFLLTLTAYFALTHGANSHPFPVLHGVIKADQILETKQRDQDKTGAEINCSHVNDFGRKASKGFETLRCQPRWTGTGSVSSPTAHDISCPRFVLVSHQHQFTGVTNRLRPTIRICRLERARGAGIDRAEEKLSNVGA